MPSLFTSKLVVAANLLALWSLPSFAVVLDCEINGGHVNPNNGNTTAGKTGIMKCKDRDTGKVVREEEYRNGRPDRLSQVHRLSGANDRRQLQRERQPRR